jgi:hypothetical protein
MQCVSAVSVSRVLQVMTAKAVQHVLAQLGETDLIICQWLNNFAAENSPLRGDEFILELMKQARTRPLYKRRIVKMRITFLWLYVESKRVHTSRARVATCRRASLNHQLRMALQARCFQRRNTVCINVRLLYPTFLATRSCPNTRG